MPVGFGQLRTATALPVMTMVCGYSRWASAVLITTRTAEELYAVVATSFDIGCHTSGVGVGRRRCGGGRRSHPAALVGHQDVLFG